MVVTMGESEGPPNSHPTPPPPPPPLHHPCLLHFIVGAVPVGQPWIPPPRSILLIPGTPSLPLVDSVAAAPGPRGPGSPRNSRFVHFSPPSRVPSRAEHAAGSSSRGRGANAPPHGAGEPRRGPPLVPGGAGAHPLQRPDRRRLRQDPPRARPHGGREGRGQDVAGRAEEDHRRVRRPHRPQVRDAASRREGEGGGRGRGRRLGRGKGCPASPAFRAPVLGRPTRSGTTVTADVMEAGHRLKLIGRAGVGVDNIDVPEATRRSVGRKPSRNPRSAAQLEAAAHPRPSAGAPGVEERLRRGCARAAGARGRPAARATAGAPRP